MIEKIKLYFIPVLISLVVGFGLGLKLSSISAKAEKYDAVTDVRKQDTKSVEQSLKTDEKIQSQIEAGNQVADDAAAKVSQTPVLGSDQNVKVIYKTKWKTKVVQCERDPHLSVGTVGLLNDARRGTPNNSPAISDAARQASSLIRVSGLVKGDIDIAKRYNELAIRHNALIDFVEQLMKDQQKRLNP